MNMSVALLARAKITFLPSSLRTDFFRFGEFLMRCRTPAKLLAFLLFLLASAMTTLASAADRPPNVLFIAIDDLKTIGTLYAEEPGNFLQHVYPDAKLRREVANRMTPNLQRLADSGVAFMNAYCAAPACNPSRAALMTGIRPFNSGLTTNAGGIFFRDYEYQGVKPLADATTLPELLQANGWYTASTGKIFHTAASFQAADAHRSWTAWTKITGGAGNKQRSLWSPPSLDWGREGGPRATFRELNDYRTADFVAGVLSSGEATHEGTPFKLSPDTPFFLACGLFRPHLPYYATQDLIDLFPADEMTITRELLELFTQDAGDLPAQAYRWSGLALDSDGHPTIGKNRFVDILTHGRKRQSDDGDLAGWKDMLTHYFASAAIADRSVGRLLDGLQAGPYGDNTMVILWSDHGYHLGEKLHQSKFTLWDAGAHVNLLIRDPRNRQSAGQKCYRPVTLTDLYPTVAKLAGVALPSPRITGSELTPLLENPQAKRSAPAHSTYQEVTHNMVRTDRYKLIRYEDDDQQIELYDMQRDPEEFENLAGRESVKQVEQELKEVLKKSLEEANSMSP